MITEIFTLSDQSCKTEVSKVHAHTQCMFVFSSTLLIAYVYWSRQNLPVHAA